jgi:hypothetical protein
MDLVTFAYLAMRGRQFVGAKLRSYAWLLRHAITIARARRATQKARRISDRQMMSVLADQVPYEQLGSPRIGKVASLLVDPWFRVYRRAMLSVVTW